MNLLCPNCQKMLQVAEQYAGQQMRCPLCANPFQVPALPSSAPAAPAAPPSAPVPEPEVYGLGPAPQPPPWPATSAPASPKPAPQPAPGAPGEPPAPPPPPPPEGYTRTSSLWISPRVVPWIAPAALALAVILTFFPWTGSYPGGHGVYTQNAWQGIWKGFSTSSVGVKVFDRKGAIDDEISFSLLGMLHMLALLAAAGASALLLAAWRGPWNVSPAIKQYLPWRTAIVAAVALGTFLLLVLLLLWGLSLENAVHAIADARVAEERNQATTDEDHAKVEIRRGLDLGEFNLRRTLWLRLVVYLELTAVIAAALDVWLHARGQRPLPRLDFLR